MTEAELQKSVAEDLKAVLEEAQSMGCVEVKAFHHIPLKNVAVVVDALEAQISLKECIANLDNPEFTHLTWSHEELLKLLKEHVV